MADKNHSNIKKYYWANALYGFSLTTPISVLYYLSHNLTYTQIGILESIFLVSILLFEIPTGVLADRYGRQKIVTAGAILLPLGALITGLGSTFPTFAFTMVIYGIAMALFSGAESALIYDTLLSTEEEKSFMKVEGRTTSLYFLFSAVAAPLGSWIFIHNHRMPYFLDSLVLFSIFFIYLSMKDVRVGEKNEKNTNLDLFIKGAKQIIHNPIVLWFVLIGIVVGTVFSVFYSLIGQPLLAHQGLPVQYIGFVLAAYMLVQSLIAANAAAIEKKLGENASLILIILLPVFCYFVMSSGVLVLTILFYMVYGIGKSFMGPVFNTYVNNNLVSESRATALSVESFAGALVGAIVLPIAGILIDRSGLENTLVMLGFFLLIFALVIYSFKPKKT